MADRRMIWRALFKNLQLSGLKHSERLLYVGTIVYADDDGRMCADPRTLKAEIFPFDEATRIDTVKEWRDNLVTSKLIKLYAAGEPVREYLYHPNWKNWQNVRKDTYHPSDCPPPPTTDIPAVTDPLQTRYRPVTQPNLTEPNLTKPNKDVSSEPETTPPAEPVSVMTFPCVGKAKEWQLTQEKIDEYRESYPNLDIITVCRIARQWCIDNPARRKTATGMPRFLSSWFAREQNSGRHITPQKSAEAEKQAKAAIEAQSKARLAAEQKRRNCLKCFGAGRLYRKPGEKEYRGLDLRGKSAEDTYTAGLGLVGCEDIICPECHNGEVR